MKPDEKVAQQPVGEHAVRLYMKGTSGAFMHVVGHSCTSDVYETSRGVPEATFYLGSDQDQALVALNLSWPSQASTGRWEQHGMFVQLHRAIEGCVVADLSEPFVHSRYPKRVTSGSTLHVTMSDGTLCEASSTGSYSQNGLRAQTNDVCKLLNGDLTEDQFLDACTGSTLEEQIELLAAERDMARADVLELDQALQNTRAMLDADREECQVYMDTLMQRQVVIDELQEDQWYVRRRLIEMSDYLVGYEESPERDFPDVTLAELADHLTVQVKAKMRDICRLQYKAADRWFLGGRKLARDLRAIIAKVTVQAHWPDALEPVRNVRAQNRQHDAVENG